MCTKKSLFWVLLSGLLLNHSVRAGGVDLKRDGAFGFPQAQAHVLCDQENLRVSVWSNAEYLYVQAVVWADGDDTTGQFAGREIGDLTSLSLDVDEDQQRTPTIDRSYNISMSRLQPQGMQYSVVLSERGSTRQQNDSAGRGSIKYLEGIDGKRYRVDSFLLPLDEIGKKLGESIRLAYWTRSAKPEYTANSVGFDSAAAYLLPMDKYHEVKLVEGAAIDPLLVPDERDDAAAKPTDLMPAAPTLTFGSRAPALDIEHWVRNGEGRFESVTEFASGKVYIVEFWATWCGPCIAAMPHIAEIQNKYADQGLQVVSISDERLDIVEKFLERKAPAQKDKEPVTFGELTGQYCLTTDPDRSNHTNYMKAAGQNGIPCAFVVGKDGFIEWIGHPMSIDKPLANIIEGNWDRDAFAVEYKQGQEIRRKSTEIINLAQTGRFEKALAIANELLEDSSTHNGKQQVESLIRLVRSREVAMHILKNSDEAPARMEALLEGRPSSEVNNFIWQDIVLVKEKGRKIGDKVLATASRLTEKAVQATPEDFYLLDTYARLLNIQGQLDKAIEVQEKAVKFTGEKERKSVEDFLQTLRQLKNLSTTKKSDVVSRKSSDMLGVWVNTDPDTGGITKIAIYEKDGATLIRAFGSCSPKDCDLGSTEFHALGDTARSMEFPYGFATWNSGFAVYYFTLKLDNDKISVTNSTIFKDKSRRTNYRSDFTFRKAEGDEVTLPPEKAIKSNRNVVGQE